MTNRFVDLTGGNNTNDGSTFANRVLTIDSSGMTAARQAAGDTIRIMKSPDPTTLSTTALWTNASRTITLTSAVNATFDNGSSWTKSANVTGTTVSGKIGNATNLIIGDPFGTGIVAYKDLGSTIDFSAYQQISFWMNVGSSGFSFASGVFRIDLCSDAVGAVPVNSLTITQTVIISSNNVWLPVVLDNGSALSSTVRSIALFAVSDPGAPTIALNNIIACKAPTSADCLTLRSVISKSNAPSGVTGWYRPASISGTAIVIDQDIQAAANAARTYEGTTETVTTYVRQCIPLSPAAVAMFIPQLSGTDGNVIAYSGGWDTTAMTTRDGETWVIDTQQSNSATGFALSTKSFLSLDRIAIVGSRGIAFVDSGTALNNSLSNCWAIGCLLFTNCNTSSSGWSFDHCYNFYGFNAGWGATNPTLIRTQFSYCAAVGTTSSGWTIGANAYLKNCIARNTGITGFSFTNSNPDEYQLDSCSGGLNVTSDVSISSPTVSAKGVDCTFSSSTQYSLPSTGGNEIAFYSINDGAVDGASVITGKGHIITQQTAVRHTASGTAWKIAVTSTNFTSLNPCRLQIASFYVSASSLVTVTAYLRRNDTGLTMKLVAPVQCGVITTESSSAISAAVDTWQQVTVTFTPAIAGVVKIWVHVSGGSSLLGYVDDLTIGQA